MPVGLAAGCGAAVGGGLGRHSSFRAEGCRPERRDFAPNWKSGGAAARGRGGTTAPGRRLRERRGGGAETLRRDGAETLRHDTPRRRAAQAERDALNGFVSAAAASRSAAPTRAMRSAVASAAGMPTPRAS